MSSVKELRGMTKVKKVKTKSVSQDEKGIELKPIFHLDKEGEYLFYKVVNYLDESSLIEDVDVITVTMLAKSLALYITIAREIHTVEDIIQTYQNGSSNVSGAFTALSKAQEQVLKLSAKLGLSPMDRSRILGAAANAEKAKGKSADGDEIDSIMA